MNFKLGEKYQIHSYKHNGEIHRAWDEAVVLEIKEDCVVFGNSKTRVTEKTGSVWRTKEPAIMYFFKDSWYNVIAQLKKDGLYYYCNIASPFIIEENTIKYIDYDLDLRVFPTGDYKVLDETEYAYHSKLMNYPDDLNICIKKGLEELINKYNNQDIVFNESSNKNYHNIYIKHTQNNEN